MTNSGKYYQREKGTICMAEIVWKVTIIPTDALVANAEDISGYDIDQKSRYKGSAKLMGKLR